MVTTRGVIGCITVMALVAVGCSSGAPTGEPANPTTAPARPAVAASYETGSCPNPIYPSVPQADLGPEVECGYLTVPQNRAEANSKKIRLPVAIRKSKSPDRKPDSVVYLAGGPGGTPLIHNFADWQLDRDLILFGQRGTLKSDPFLNCPEYDEFLSAAVGIGAEDPEYASKSGAAARACRDRLAADGVDLATYNSTESAADVAELQTAMGVDRWNIYGLSYGTYLALQVLRDHPDGIRSVVLDSVLPAQYNLIESGWPAAAHSFNAVFDGCAAETACAAAFPDVRAEFVRMVSELSAKPMRVTVDVGGKPVEVVIDGYKLASGVVVAAAQSPGQLARIPLMIHQLATGDPTAVAEALGALTPANVLSFGLEFSVLCRENVARTTPEEVLVQGRQALRDFPDAVLALPAQVPTMFTDCQEWNVPGAPPAVEEPVSSDVPILMASGSFDSATPPYLAVDAAKTLPNSQHLVFPGTGHEVALNTPDAASCFIGIMRSFYDNPRDFNTDCVATLTIPPFATN